MTYTNVRSIINKNTYLEMIDVKNNTGTRYSGPKDRQLEVYDYIVKYTVKHLYPPTVREICDGTGMKSTATGLHYIKELKEWGLIDYQSTQPRTIRLQGYKLVKE